MTSKSFLRTHDNDRQLELMQRQECRRSKQYRDPGIKNPEDFTEQVIWVYNNMWKPKLSPVDMPFPSWWTLFNMARENRNEFVRDYVKPLMVNAIAQRTARENSRQKSEPKDSEPKDVGGSQLDAILGYK